MIYILKGNIGTGKTTSIFRSLNSLGDVDGILQPVVSDKRFAYFISKKNLSALEADERDEDIFEIGKYRFRKSVFELSEKHLLHCLKNETVKIIFDEYGKLEMQGRGLSVAADLLVEARRKSSDKHCIFIIRSEIVQFFLERYKLTDLEYQFVIAENDGVTIP